MNQNNYDVENVDWEDFMNNDNNTTLVRLANQLAQDPEFLDILRRDYDEELNDDT